VPFRFGKLYANGFKLRSNFGRLRFFILDKKVALQGLEVGSLLLYDWLAKILDEVTLVFHNEATTWKQFSLVLIISIAAEKDPILCNNIIFENFWGILGYSKIDRRLHKSPDSLLITNKLHHSCDDHPIFLFRSSDNNT